MKIEFDYLDVFEGKDKLQCNRIGQIISWDMANRYICRSSDILTDQKKEAFRKTLQNVADYVGRLIKVKHRDITVIPVNGSFSYIPRKNESNSDHYIFTLIRPFDNAIIGASSIVAIDNKTGRVIQSEITINSQFIEKEEQNEESEQRNLFHTIFHEVIHSLGLTEELMGSWIDRATGLPYKTFPLHEYKISPYNKTFFQLCTPKAMEVAQKRLNKREYSNGITVCLEMEDNGRKGTEKCHPKSTIYRQDVMTAILSVDAVVSEVLLAIIEDMGWYTVDWKMAKPLTWGAKELINPHEMKTYSDKPTRFHLAGNHFSEWKNAPFIGHDYRSYGHSTMIEYDHNDDYEEILQYGDLYINNSISFINPNSPYDYCPLKSPSKLCKEGEWAISFINGSLENDVTCVNSKYNQTHFTFRYGNSAYSCRQAGEEVRIMDVYVFYCPDINLISSVDTFLKMSPKDYGHITLIGDSLSGDNNGRTKIYIIVISSVIIALIVSIIFLSKNVCRKFCFLCCCQTGNLNNTESMKESTLI